MKKLFLAILLLVTFSCGQKIQVDSKFQSITNGSLPNSAKHDAVVALLQKGPQQSLSFFCSGTLISSNTVLSAAHCLQGIRPNKLMVFVGDNLFLGGNFYEVSVMKVHSNYNPQFLTDDIALLRLKTAVSGAVPVPFLPSSEKLTVADSGLAVNFSGFGQDSEGPSGTGGSGVKLQVDSPFGGVTNPCEQSDGSVINCLTNEGYQAWYKQGSNQGGPCFGDSGGPMFLERNGVTYVAGITSYGDFNCNRYGVSTRPDAYECWIERFTLGGCPSSCSLKKSGETCSVNEDCCSNKCRGKKGFKTCL